MRIKKRPISVYAVLFLFLCCPAVLILGFVGNRLIQHRAISGSVLDYSGFIEVSGLKRWVAAIPREAKGIRYFATPLGPAFDADFHLDEEEFLRWARHQDWTLTRIGPSSGRRIPVTQPDGSEVYVVLSEGYYFHRPAVREDDGERAEPDIEVAFDRQSERVYYHEHLPD